jgi:hypothetical protein
LPITKTDKAAKELLWQTVTAATECQQSVVDSLVWNKAGSGDGHLEDWIFGHILDDQAAHPQYRSSDKSKHLKYHLKKVSKDSFPS